MIDIQLVNEQIKEATTITDSIFSNWDIEAKPILYYRRTLRDIKNGIPYSSFSFLVRHGCRSGEEAIHFLELLLI